MFPNWTGWHTIKIALASLTTFAGGLVAGFPGTVTAHDAGVAVILLGAITGAVVTASGSSSGPALAARSKPTN